MTKLILIGYWRGADDPNWPDPAKFVDPDWDQDERDLVAVYLGAGTEIEMYMGFSHCRLCEKRDNGSRELTDGVYVWPEGLKHYVADHNVRLPRRFVEHVRRRTTFGLRHQIYDSSWWQTVTPGD